MGQLGASISVTLDGVMEDPAPHGTGAPASGFAHGGWAMPYSDAELGSLMAEHIGDGPPGALLLGRRTYEELASTWPHAPADNQYTEMINSQRKYVASTTLGHDLAWNNSVLLEDDVATAVAALKRKDEPLTVLGSGTLLQTLLAHDLVDEIMLLIHPLVLGAGRRLFPDGGVPATFALRSTASTSAGVVVASYGRVDAA